MKKILVTGATGFVGSHLVQKLIKKGWEVDVIVRAGSKLENIGVDLNRIKVHLYDGTTESVLKIMAESKPETVFHLASKFLARHESGDIIPLVQSNITFGSQLVEAMVKNGVNHLVNTGTSWQHYKNKAYNPVCLYAATKQAFEDILAYYTDSSQLKVVTLKLFDTYGPGDNRPKLFSLLNKALAGGTPLAMSPGEQMVDLVYIDDVVEAFLVADRIVHSSSVKSQVFAVSSLRPIPLRKIVETYACLSKKELRIKWGAIPYREREVMIPWKKKELLPKWKPKVSLEAGIKKLLAQKLKR